MSHRSVDLSTHRTQVHDVSSRLLTRAGLSGSMVRTPDGAAVHVTEKGTGRPVVMIHGSGSPALFWLPVLERLRGVRAIAVDRPGFGLSDPVPAGQAPHQTAAGWIDDLLDALKLPSAILVGHSMGGLWSLRFALARPERVDGLVMIGTPALPGTRAPLPFRMLGTPGVGALIVRQRETPTSVRQFAARVGEGDAIASHPDLVDLLVAVGNDPVATRALHREVRALLSPWALLTPSGFRRSVRVSEADVGGLSVPTLLVWGEHDPVGEGDVARRLADLIPHADVEVVDGGHAPWLGQPGKVAQAIGRWVGRLP